MKSLPEQVRATLEWDEHIAEEASDTSEGRWLSVAGIAEVNGARRERARTRPLDELVPEMVEVLAYCKGTIEQLVNDHTKVGAWQDADKMLARIRQALGGDSE